MTDTIVCRVGDVVRRGRAVSLAQSVDPMAVAAAVRADGEHEQIAVDAPDPSPVHEHVGCIRPEMGLRTRTALARGARSLGHETPHDEALAAARADLDALEVGESADRARHRRAAAEASAASDELRERVAAARGRLQAREESGLDPTPAADDLAEAVAALSEAETAAAAADQQLDRSREAARERRERHERRLRLEDRVANLERAARAHLVEQTRDDYADCLRDVPGVESIEDPLAADPVPAALAIARFAALSAPVVLVCNRFGSPAAASEWLDAPVVEV
jgi:hypothetical protein